MTILARTSMTQGGSKKLRSEKLRAEFSFPIARTKDQPKEEVFGMDIPRTFGGDSGGVPGPKPGSRPSEPWKKKHNSEDIHDPKARTYTALSPGEKRHININFLLWLTSRWPWDKRLVVPGLTGPKSLCVRLETQET